jgi:ParB family transcriptional regulator, chromosome partitioning protein
VSEAANVETGAPAEGQPQEAAPQQAPVPAAAPSEEAAPVADEVEEPVRSPKPGALALLKLEKVDDDDAYRLRPEGEVEPLATSMARLGQLFPVDLRLKPPDRFQIVAGFRRVAALRLLKRERVLARVHTDLSDEDALRLALADLLEHRGVQREDLVRLQQKLEGEGRLTAHVKEALERFLSPTEALGPETVEDGEEEVDLDELAQDIAKRLAGINQDLALVAELWSAMDPTLRRALLEQLAYPEQLAAYLRSL